MKKNTAKTQQWVSNSETETKKIGEQLAKRLHPGDVVALYGDLGAGKTTLVKGIARGLGIRSDEIVSSPTYVMIHEYHGKAMAIYHLDWYRLKKVDGADRAMADECFYSNGVTLVEWPERGRSLLPERHLQVRLAHRGPVTRAIEVSGS